MCQDFSHISGLSVILYLQNQAPVAQGLNGTLSFSSCTDDYTYYFHVVFRWFKYISDATEAYRVKSRNSKVEVVEPVQAAPLQVPEPVQATPSIQAQETATTAIQDLEKDSVTTSTTTTHQADSGDTKKDDDKE